MSLSKTKCTKIFLIFSNVIFSWISGGFLVLFGGASLYDPSYMHMHTILTVDKVPQYVFILFALSIVALGGFIITLGLFGCFGSLCDNNCIIKTYTYLLFFVFVAELGLCAGSLYLYFTFPTLGVEIKDDLVEKLKTDFGYPLQYTFNTAMDYTQATLHCCGLNNYTDFENSNWRSMANNHELSVPFSCCSATPISKLGFLSNNSTFFSTESEEDLHLLHEASTESMNPSTTGPSWWKRCQSLNPMESDDYLYAQGCWGQVEEIYMRLALYTAILFASLALLQMLGVIMPICWLRRTEHKQHDIRIRTSRQAQPLL